MKKLMYIKALDSAQEEAKSRITELESAIRHAKTITDLKTAILEVRQIWAENFSTEELMNPDPTWEPLHETLYKTKLKALGVEENTMTATNITINIQSGGTAVFKFNNNTFRWV